MNIRTAGILWNPGKENGLPVARTLAGCLRARGCALLGDENLSRLLSIAPMPAGNPGVDLLFVLGGDGTVLSALDRAVPWQIPILGVNLGRLGFLSEVEPENLEADLEKLFRGDYWFDDRMLMTLERAAEDCFALNEIVISRKNAAAGIFSVEARANGTLIDRISGDGLIVASATGSTAYSLSAGGPIVAPGLECFVITPVCPHTMNARPVVASAQERIGLRVLDKPGEACAVFDGRRVYPFSEEKAEITIVKSRRFARFVRLHRRNYFNLLRNKLSQWTH